MDGYTRAFTGLRRRIQILEGREKERAMRRDAAIADLLRTIHHLSEENALLRGKVSFFEWREKSRCGLDNPPAE